MTLQRALIRADISSLGEGEVVVTMSTDALARDGHILVPEGCVLDNYRSNPIILWNHDPSCPVATADDIAVSGGKITARVRFAPNGASAKADEIRALVKSGVIRGVSVGFEPLEMEPLDPKKPRGGQRISKWELLECSFVSIPADTGAAVTARAKRSDDMAENWTVGVSRDLPIEDSDEWDGAEAEKSIFEWAGGDEFDPKKAKKGFLVYDASAPEKRGSYKLPIAHVVDGRLKVPKGAIRAAASRLPQSDLPQEVKDEAQKVIDAYKEKAGIGEENKEKEDKDRSTFSPWTRVNTTPNIRSLYDVGMLAYVLDNLGYCQMSAAWEAAIEEDESQVPAMLGEAIVKVGEALIAMTAEEVSELIAATTPEPEAADAALTEGEREYIRSAKSPAARAFRRGVVAASIRSGKTLSDDTVRCLNHALESHRSGVKEVEDLLDRCNARADDKENDSEEERAASARRRRQTEVLKLRIQQP